MRGDRIVRYADGVRAIRQSYACPTCGDIMEENPRWCETCRVPGPANPLAMCDECGLRLVRNFADTCDVCPVCEPDEVDRFTREAARGSTVNDTYPPTHCEHCSTNLGKTTYRIHDRLGSPTVDWFCSRDCADGWDREGDTIFMYMDGVATYKARKPRQSPQLTNESTAGHVGADWSLQDIQAETRRLDQNNPPDEWRRVGGEPLGGGLVAEEYEQNTRTGEVRPLRQSIAEAVSAPGPTSLPDKWKNHTIKFKRRDYFPEHLSSDAIDREWERINADEREQHKLRAARRELDRPVTGHGLMVTDLVAKGWHKFEAESRADATGEALGRHFRVWHWAATRGKTLGDCK